MQPVKIGYTPEAVATPLSAPATNAPVMSDTDHGVLNFYYQMEPFDRFMKFIQLFGIILSIIVSIRVLFFKK